MQLKINIMPRPRNHPLFVLLLAGSLASACHASAPPVSPAPAVLPRTGIALYLPLEDNTVLAYNTSNDLNEKGFFAVQVARKPGSLVELRAGAKSQQLTLSANAVRHTSGGFLLKWPVRTGDTFPGEFGLVRVVATDRTAQVPAGSFSGCIETLEGGGAGALQQQSIKMFCPNVGLVSFENTASQGSDVSSQRAELRSYGPKVDVFAEAADLKR